MKVNITVRDFRFYVQFAYNALLVERFRIVPGRKYHPEDKTWSFPMVRDVLLMVCDVCGILPWMLCQELRDLAGPSPEENIARIALDMSVIDGHNFNTKPFDHQRINLARLVQNKRWLLCDEMGTGKSAAIINRIARLPDDSKILILCPKSVISGWHDQFSLHYDRYEWRILKNSIWIANYERLFAGDVPSEWDLVVFDEIHRLKNFTAKASRICRKISENSTYVYGTSGTPAPNGLEDWFGVISAIDPSLLPVGTKTGFEARYCVKARLSNDPGSPFYNKWKISGYRNVSELHRYIASVSSRVTKKECLDLPDKTFSNRVVDLNEEQKRIYNELKKKAVARLTEAGETLTVANVISESMRLLQVVGGFIPDDEGKIHEIEKKAKVEALDDIVEEIGEKQMVVWCVFQEEARFLQKHLEKIAPTSILTGNSKDLERAEAIENFRTGKHRFFVGTSAGGEGINGLQVADTEVFYSRSWNLKNYLQQVDRLHRIGQMNSVSVIHLVANCTVDQKVADALERKEMLQEMMMQNPEELF